MPFYYISNRIANIEPQNFALSPRIFSRNQQHNSIRSENCFFFFLSLSVACFPSAVNRFRIQRSHISRDLWSTSEKKRFATKSRL